MLCCWKCGRSISGGILCAPCKAIEAAEIEASKPIDWQSRALTAEAEVERLRAFAETVYWLLPSGEDPAQVSPGLHKAQFGWAFNMRVFTPEIRGQMTPQELHILEALEKVVSAWTK